MPTIYAECPRDVADLAAEIIQANYSDLTEADVTIKYLFARADGDAPALTHNGYAAVAVARINNLQKRVEGLTDATIAIDQERWDESASRRRAIMAESTANSLSCFAMPLQVNRSWLS